MQAFSTEKRTGRGTVAPLETPETRARGKLLEFIDFVHAVDVCFLQKKYLEDTYISNPYPDADGKKAMADFCQRPIRSINQWLV